MPHLGPELRRAATIAGRDFNVFTAARLNHDGTRLTPLVGISWGDVIHTLELEQVYYLIKQLEAVKADAIIRAKRGRIPER